MRIQGRIKELEQELAMESDPEGEMENYEYGGEEGPEEEELRTFNHDRRVSDAYGLGGESEGSELEDPDLSELSS